MSRHVKDRAKMHTPNSQTKETDPDSHERLSNNTGFNPSRLERDSTLDDNFHMTDENCLLFDDCTIEPAYNETIVQNKKARLAKLS